MSIVPSAPGGLFDPFRRRVEFADVFAAPEVRGEVAALMLAIRRGCVNSFWVRDVFHGLVGELVRGVRGLDRGALRVAYTMLFVEEPAVIVAVRDLLVEVGGDELALHVVDAVGEVIGAATGLGELARAWAWFMSGDSDADS